MQSKHWLLNHCRGKCHSRWLHLNCLGLKIFFWYCHWETHIPGYPLRQWVLQLLQNSDLSWQLVSCNLSLRTSGSSVPYGTRIFFFCPKFLSPHPLLQPHGLFSLTVNYIRHNWYFWHRNLFISSKQRIVMRFLRVSTWGYSMSCTCTVKSPNSDRCHLLKHCYNGLWILLHGKYCL